jgi:PAS domain S-box-containing protein
MSEAVLKLVSVRAAGELERKQGEEILRESEERFRQLGEAAFEGIAVTEKGQLADGNSQLSQMLGYEFSEMMGKPVSDFIAPESRDLVLEMIRANNEQPYEHLLLRKDGSTFPVESHAKMITWKGKSLRVTALRDITERKQAEDAIQKSEQKFREIFNNANDAIYIMGLAEDGMPGKFTEVNNVACRMLGYSREEFLDMSAVNINAEDISKKLPKMVSPLLSQGRMITETVHRTKDGRKIPVEINSRIVEVMGEIKILSVARDITERKQAEKQLRESESLLRTMAENYPNSYISIIEKNLTIGFTSGQEFKKQNLDPSQFVGLTLEQVFGEYTPLIRDNYLKAFDGAETQFELFINNQYQYYRTVPLMNQDGRITKILTVVENVTERKQAESERERLLAEVDQKNKELESLVYIASHDMRSPLVTVQGFGGNIQKYCRQISEIMERAETLDELRSTAKPLLEEKIPNALRFINSSSMKMHTLVDGLLRLSRVGSVTLQMEEVDMNLMLQHIQDTFAFQAEKFNAQVKVEKPLAECYGDKNQLNQVFSNLLDNAIKYRDAERPLVITISSRVEGRKVIYTIADSGIGISLEDQEKIWILFRRVGSDETIPGEGLGLALVQRIVERHGGKVWVESEIGVGSRFHVELPRSVGSEQ